LWKGEKLGQGENLGGGQSAQGGVFEKQGGRRQGSKEREKQAGRIGNGSSGVTRIVCFGRCPLLIRIGGKTGSDSERNLDNRGGSVKDRRD